MPFDLILKPQNTHTHTQIFIHITWKDTLAPSHTTSYQTFAYYIWGKRFSTAWTPDIVFLVCLFFWAVSTDIGSITIKFTIKIHYPEKISILFMVLHPELKIKPALKVQKLQFLDWPLEASSRSEGNSHVKKRSFTAEQSMFTTMDSVDRCRCTLLEHISVPLEAFRVFFYGIIFQIRLLCVSDHPTNWAPVLATQILMLHYYFLHQLTRICVYLIAFIDARGNWKFCTSPVQILVCSDSKKGKTTWCRQ